MPATLETVRCNLCGADDTELLYRLPVQPHQVGEYAQDLWDVVRCRRCGLIYENPRPAAAALQTFYNFESEADYAFVQDAFVNSAALQQNTWQRILRVIRKYCSHGVLLDVGCGSGSFLVTARQGGFDVWGQDISPYFANYCRIEHNLRIYDTSLSSLALARPHQFDCVTLFDVIEHHPDPRALLSDIRLLLQPGGLVAISTPDIRSPFARLYGSRWRQLYAIGHLTYFNRATLRCLLEDVGFKVVQFGGLHTIDANALAERRNWIAQFFKLILLRALILGLYRPLTSRIHLLSRWRLTWRNLTLNHELVLVRTGKNIIMNDDMVCLAVLK